MKHRIVGSIHALNHKFSMLPKVEARPKGHPLGFVSALCDFFSKIFEFNQSKGTLLHFFDVFPFVKTFNEPEWPIFEIFGNVRRFLKITFFEKLFFRKYFF